MRIFKYFPFLVLFASCSAEKETLEPGTWRGVLYTQEQELPFNLEIAETEQGFHAYFINADEKLDAGAIRMDGDSLVIPMGYFDASIKAKLSNGELKGYYTKHFANNYFVPLALKPGSYRFSELELPAQADYSGKWEVSFYDPDEDKYTPSLGVFEQEGSKLKGTFLTPTGDYRFLQGDVIDSKLNLSTFDGEHLYLFKGTLQDSLIQGEYFSGLGGYKTWTARRNPDAQAPNAEDITFMKEGYESLSFSFPDMNGNMVSLSDEKFQDKVVIVQIFGTWCPNCMDETKFLSNWYDENKDRGIEIVGLSYENKDDFEYAKNRIQKMVDKLNVKYDFLFAGSRDNKKASATLPMLNKVTAFPTTIFIDKEGKVRRIHTGFAGPGTGHYYTDLVEEFNKTVDELVSEEESSD